MMPRARGSWQLPLNEQQELFTAGGYRHMTRLPAAAAPGKHIEVLDSFGDVHRYALTGERRGIGVFARTIDGEQPGQIVGLYMGYGERSEIGWKELPNP